MGINLGSLHHLIEGQILDPDVVNENFSMIADAVVQLSQRIDLVVSEGINGLRLVDGSVHGLKLTDASVPGNKLMDDAITTAKIADAAVTTSKLDNNSVTSDKLADSIVLNDLTAETVSAKTITNLISMPDTFKVGYHGSYDIGTSWTNKEVTFNIPFVVPDNARVIVVFTPYTSTSLANVDAVLTPSSPNANGFRYKIKSNIDASGGVFWLATIVPYGG